MMVLILSAAYQVRGYEDQAGQFMSHGRGMYGVDLPFFWLRPDLITAATI